MNGCRESFDAALMAYHRAEIQRVMLEENAKLAALMKMKLSPILRVRWDS